MQEYTTPGEQPLNPAENLTTSLWERERSTPQHPILAYRAGDEFRDIDYAEMAAQVRRLAAGFIGLGIEPGSRVCILSPTRHEFTLLDYAIWAAGAASVTIYDTSSAEQVEWIVRDSGAVAIVCADDELVKVFSEQAGKLDSCRHVFSIDSGGLDQLRDAGAAITDDEVMERARSVSQADLATLVYTSGTTGRAKGCELTVRNFVWDVTQVRTITEEVLNEDASTLMFLPLAHIFARLIQVASIMTGAKIAFSSGIPNLMEELQMVKPTWLFSVPRVFEKVYNGASQRAHSEGKGRIFDLAASVAGDYSRQREAGKVGLRTRLLHGVFDRLVYGKLRHALGGRARYAISGGAALGERLGHFFNGIGLTVLEGYGLTETAAGCTVNSPGHVKIGTVGRPLPGATLRITDEGEILVKGGHVFRGYWNNPEATDQAVDAEGWFHTGDVGSLDEDGYLRISGRTKEIIVTAGGKNVAPAVLEDLLRAHPLVSQCMVVGDDKPFIAALVTVDPDEFPRWASEQGKEGSLADLVDDPDLRAAIQAAVESANATVSRAEGIRSFRVLPDDFTIEGGELTPTLKVRRAVVYSRYNADIDALYS